MSNTRRPNGDRPTLSRKAERAKQPRPKWVRYSLIAAAALVAVIGIAAIGVVVRAYWTLPVVGDIDPNLSTVILDRNGKPVYSLAAEENRTLIKDISEIPEPVRMAFVATEDRRFYSHFGIDVYRLFGALWSDIKYFLNVPGSQFEGASTITMQLARNAYLTPDQNMTRKIQEMIIATKLERSMTKDEILLHYLNQVPFGYQAAGLESAAQTYFSKSAKDLTVSEAALLAGMLKAPTTYNPISNYEGAMERRGIVLDLMAKYGELDKEEAERLKAEPVEINPAAITPSSVTFPGDWYVDYVIDILTTEKLSQKYGTPLYKDVDLFSSGFKIHTAMDMDYQLVAQNKVQTMMPDMAVEFGGSGTEVPQAAVVIKNHRTGDILAMVGGLEHTTMRAYNRAVDAYRQPGSAIKPLTAYLPAIDTLGWGPSTVIDDSPVSVLQGELWPRNYENRYQGLLPMRRGVEQSINTMAVRSVQAVGPAKAMEYGQKLGLTSLVQEDNNLAPMALGGLNQGVNVLDMTSAFGVLGSLGQRVDSVVITKIEDKHGEIIWEANPQKEQVVNRDSAWLMVDIMKGVIRRGTASYESQGFRGWPAAGKTGTTEYSHDAWVVAFTPEIVTGIWTGYDNHNGLKKLPATNRAWTGAGPPTRMWREIMSEIVTEQPADWERPGGVTQVQICRTSGMRPSDLCPKDDITTDWFRKGFEPKVDNVWTKVKVVKQQWIDPATKKSSQHYVLWKEGCSGTPEERLMIRRPTTYPKHPRDPWNYARYWPQDWVKEVPTEVCTPGADLQPGDDQEPPPDDGDGQQPPDDNLPPDDAKPPEDEEGDGNPGDGNNPTQGEEPPEGGGQPSEGGTPPPQDKPGLIPNLLPKIRLN